MGSTFQGNFEPESFFKGVGFFPVKPVFYVEYKQGYESVTKKFG